MKAIGDNIKRLRKYAELTQAGLGEKIGVGGATISSWEKGRTEPNMGDIENLAHALNVTKTDIVGEISFLANPTTTQQILIEVSKMNEDDKKHLLSYIQFMYSKEGK